MNSKVLLIFRKRLKGFNSIENVFNTLAPFLKCDRLELNYPSSGLTFRIKNIFQLIRNKNKIIHITGHDHYLLWWPFRNTILTIHDIESLKRKTGLKKWIFKKMWFDWPMKNAKVITTISEFSKQEILSLGDYEGTIKVINNPLCLPITYFPKQINTFCPRIVHIGVKANKNLDRLIIALEGIRCELVIIGKSNSSILDLLEEKKVSYSFKSNLSEKQMMEEYKACDIVSFISTYEGFGLPIIEAQAIGRPLIASNVASIPEVAGDGALLVNPFELDEIRNGLIQLISDDELRNRLIEKGLENVKQFKPEYIAAQYLQIYNSIQCF